MNTRKLTKTNNPVICPGKSLQTKDGQPSPGLHDRIMKMRNRTSSQSISKSCIFLAIFGLTTAAIQNAGAGENSMENAAADWQMKQIYQPSETLLKREQRGLVTIYDGFTDVEVIHVLDHNFPRMGNMMFTRIKTTDSQGQLLRDAQTGEEVTEEDGC